MKYIQEINRIIITNTKVLAKEAKKLSNLK